MAALPFSSPLPSISPSPPPPSHTIPTSLIFSSRIPPSSSSSSSSHRFSLRSTTPLQTPITTTTSDENSFPKPFKNSIWINPSSPNSASLRRNSSDSHYSRLTLISSSLDLNPSTIPHLLPSTLPDSDAAIILNNIKTPAAALPTLRHFLQNPNLKKPVILFNIALKILRNTRDWDSIESLLTNMLTDGVSPDNITISTVISSARFCNLPAKAVEWFERMPEFGLTPDDITYSAIIDAYGRSGNVDMALTLYDLARKGKWRLDPVTCATVIRIYGSSGNFDGALNVFEEMKAIGVKPNLVTYNKLLDVMGRASRPWQVKSIYREMVSNEISPNKITYSALIRSYSKARYVNDALTMYKEMRAKKMQLNTVLYNTLLSMCADTGNLDDAIGIFEEMKGTETESNPDSWSYSSLITAYACAGKVGDVERLLSEMTEAGFQPTIFVLTSVIQCYGKAKMVDDVVRTFNRLMETGVSPDDRFCGCLLNVLTQTPGDEFGKVIEIIEMSNRRLGALVKLIVDSGGSEEELMLRKEAEELFGSVSEVVKRAFCNCLMDVCVNVDQPRKALLLLNLGQELDIYPSLQSKTETQWSLHVKSLSPGAALTALKAWMNDMSEALENGEELPPLLGIHTGHGKHKYSERGLASSFESHLREMNAPFHEASGDKVGWFLTTSIAAKSWLGSRVSSAHELVVAP